MDPERLSPEEAQRELDEWAHEHNEAVAARRKDGFTQWRDKLIADGFKHRKSRNGGRPKSVTDIELVNAYHEAVRMNPPRRGNEKQRPFYRMVARTLSVRVELVAKRLPRLLRGAKQK